MKKYAIGIDFGTLSCRALLVSLVGEDAGAELACAVCDYPHGVMDKTLSASGESLPADYALQDPEDYLYALSQVVPEVIAKAGVDKADVVSVGVDFTCSTLIPVYENGLPLCFDPKFAKEKHAYVKLWKHHAAQPYADRITELATQRGEPWIARMGGKVSSEFTLPKLWELLDCAPDVYEACDSVVEAGDFIVSHLVGTQVRSYVTAAYKAQYSEADGYPSEDFLAALDERLRYAARDKLFAPLLKAGSLAGRVTRAAAENFGLPEGAAVSVAMPDAHVAAPAMGVLRPGKTVGIFGTSNCYYFLSEEDIAVSGICGSALDGVAPSLYGHEAGLCCAGDHFAWFANNFTTAEIAEAAHAADISPIAYMISEAAQKRPGESGLIALDWWNGNRNILNDSDLSGVVLGMNLRTRPHDVLRALVEATAFATRVIFENFEKHGIRSESLVAAGGMARKDPFMMQIYADVLRMRIEVVSSANLPSLASAIYSSVAAGVYPDIYAASDALASKVCRTYEPNEENSAIYDRLYAEYLTLHDYFGRGANDVMKRLRALAAEVREQ